MKEQLRLAVLLCFLFAGNANSQGLSSYQIDSIVQKSMGTMPLAGMAIAVVKNDTLLHAKGYGLTSANSDEKVNENTLFAIASNSKAFTTAALAILVDEGKLQWTDKVVEHIPEFKMYDPYITENFNVQDLLTHRSGLGLGAGDLMFFPDGTDFTVNDVLRSFQYQKPVSAFRTKYDYDNLLYVVAGELVARVSGISWADFVESRIMRPLGMQRSVGVYQRLKEITNVAYPHSVKNKELHVLQPYQKGDETLGAAGGIYASVSDLSKWMQMHLNQGSFGTKLEQRMISKKNHEELWKPHTNIGFEVLPEPPYKTHFNAYGLGWFIKDRAGYVVLEHTGGLPGMLSRTILIPELKIGIVVLTNTDPGGYAYWTIAQQLMDAYLKVEKKDWTAWAEERIRENDSKGDSVTTAVWDVVEKAKHIPVDFDNYVGVYSDRWFGDIKIERKGKNLWFTSLRSPKLNGEMFYYKANTFAIAWEYTDMPCDAFALFNLDENGKAISIRMKGISPTIDFSFDFQDLNLVRVD